MSIKEESYNLCKMLKKNNIREDVRKLVSELTRCTEETMRTEKDRSDYGYLARHQYSQFMGYLIVDERREEINKSGLHKVPFISDGERELLRKAHYLIKYIDQRCVSKVLDVIPNLKKTLDPYSQFPYPDFKESVEGLIDYGILESLENQYYQSKPLVNILGSPRDLSTKIENEKYLGVTLEFTDRINNCGVHDAPEDFKELYFKRNVKSPEYVVSKLLFSVLCLRGMLNTMNQMLYQAFLYDKLPLLNEDNIIEISKQNSHFVGEGITIINQPLGEELFTEPGDLILLKLKLNNHIIDKLCVVYGKTINFSKEFGDTQKYNLRVVDDNLNSFMGLLNLYC